MRPFELASAWRVAGRDFRAAAGAVLYFGRRASPESRAHLKRFPRPQVFRESDTSNW